MDLFTLLEDRTQGYLHLLKGSKAPVPKKFTLDGEVFSLDDIDTESGEPPSFISDIAALHSAIIDEVESVIDPAFKKYEEYFIQQVAKGYMPLNKIEEDGERFNITLRLFQKLSRKAMWKGPKNIFQFENWRELEKLTKKAALEAGIPEEEIPGGSTKDSVILFTKTYPDTRAELLSSIFDEPAEAAGAGKTYYLRKVLTPEGACRYGRGTQWCTATKNIKPKITVDDMKADASRYGVKFGDNASRLEIFIKWAPMSGGTQVGYTGLFDDKGQLHPERSKYFPPETLQNILDFMAGKVDWIYNPAYYFGHAMNYIKDGLYIIELEDKQPRRPVLQISDHQIMTIEDLSVTKAGPRLRDFIQSAMAAVPSEKLKGFEGII